LVEDNGASLKEKENLGGSVGMRSSKDRADADTPTHRRGYVAGNDLTRYLSHGKKGMTAAQV